MNRLGSTSQIMADLAKQAIVTCTGKANSETEAIHAGHGATVWVHVYLPPEAIREAVRRIAERN